MLNGGDADDGDVLSPGQVHCCAISTVDILRCLSNKEYEMNLKEYRKNIARN